MSGEPSPGAKFVSRSAIGAEGDGSCHAPVERAADRHPPAIAVAVTGEESVLGVGLRDLRGVLEAESDELGDH